MQQLQVGAPVIAQPSSAPVSPAVGGGQQDNFVRAVLLTFDPTLPAGGLKAAAQQYVDQVRASPDGWRLCLQKLHEVALARGADEVKFFCLSHLHGLAEKRYPTLTEEERNALRRSLMLYVRDVIPVVPPQAGYLQNKLCAIFVHIVLHDYPSAWPSFFADFLGMLDKGPEVIDVFVRLLKILDEDVVDATQSGGVLGEDRGGGGSSSSSARGNHLRCTAIKDSMRERDLQAIVDAIYSICQLYHNTRPALVASALEAFSEYIEWIDINLVANERFLTIFYAFMNPQQSAANGDGSASSAAAAAAANNTFAAAVPSTPATSARLNLQIYATDCVIEIIGKRMDPTKKVQQLQQLRILDFISNALLPAQANQLLPHQSPNPRIVQQALAHYAEKPAGIDASLPDKYAQTIVSMLESIGSQLIRAIEKLIKPATTAAALAAASAASAASAGAGGASGANAASSASRSGSNVNNVAGFAPGALSPQTLQLVTEAMSMLEACLQLSYRFFSHPFYRVSEDLVKLYVEYVQMIHLAKRPGNTWPWSASAREHLRRIFDGLGHALAFPAWFNHAARGDDEEDAFVEHRSALLKLFTNMTSCCPPLLLELASARIKDTLARLPSLPYSAVEVTLQFFYKLGEQPLMGSLHACEEPYRSLVGSLLSSNVSSYPHPVVQLLYFEIVVRYVKFLEQNPEFLGPVLASFLDARGLRNAHATVRGRASYLFHRCLQVFPPEVKKRLHPFLDSMLKEIQTVIETVLGPNAPAARLSSPAKGKVEAAGRAAADGGLVSFESLCYLCESMGILVASSVTGVEQCHRYVSLAFHFFRTQLESAVAPQSVPLWHPANDERAGERLAQLIEALSVITKPLSADSLRINDLMLEMAQLVLQVLTLLPNHPSVVSKTIFFALRLIDCHPFMSAAQQAQLAQAAALTGTPAVNPDGPVLQFMTLVLQLLLTHAQPSSIVPIFDLLNLIVKKEKFGKKAEAMLDQLFLLACEKIFAALATYAHIDAPQQTPASAAAAAAAAGGSNGVPRNLSSSPPPPLPSAAYSTERQERLSMQLRYYTLLQNMVESDLWVSVLTSPTNGRHIKSVLDTLMQGMLSDNGEAAIPRTCFNCMKQLVGVWDASGALKQAADPSLKLFVMRDVSLHLFKSVCGPRFDLADPLWINAMRELLELQKAICKALGDEYLAFLAGELMPGALQLPPDAAQLYARAVVQYNEHKTGLAAGHEWKHFQGFFQSLKAMTAQMQQQQQQRR